MLRTARQTGSIDWPQLFRCKGRALPSKLLKQCYGCSRLRRLTPRAQFWKLAAAGSSHENKSDGFSKLRSVIAVLPKFSGAHSFRCLCNQSVGVAMVLPEL